MFHRHKTISFLNTRLDRLHLSVTNWLFADLRADAKYVQKLKLFKILRERTGNTALLPVLLTDRAHSAAADPSYGQGTQRCCRSFLRTGYTALLPILLTDTIHRRLLNV